MLFLLGVYIVYCGLICLVRGQILQISTKFMSGNVIFIWTPSNYSYYDVELTTNINYYSWTRVSDAKFTVMNALLNDSIIINVKPPGSKTNNRMTYNVSKVKTQTRSTEAVSWTAQFFPQAGQYHVFHTYSDNRTIFSISRSGVSYGTKNISTKYTYISRPFASTNITFEIKDISLDDAGYYNGGTFGEAAWSGGGVVLIVKNGPSKPKITGNLDVEVTKYITLTCSSQSMSAPDYYSKLVTLSYTWFVNDTKLNGETRETLRLIVTRNLKYNRYSCTATEEDLESEKSDRVQINPLSVPQTPLNFTGYSYSIGSVNLTWVSGFNGGPEQFFILSLMEGSTWREIGNISDPGEGKLVYFDPGFYIPGQEYSFRIFSCNRINCSSVPTDTKVKVKGGQKETI